MNFSQALTQGSPHHMFATMAGSWAGSSRTWLEPGAPAHEARTHGSIQLILEGRFAIYIYQSALEGEVQHGMFTFGYNTLLDRCEATWVDSFHNNTAIMYCVGTARDGGFYVLGSYPDPSGGPDWGWRTDVEFPDSDHLVITAYNIPPEGAEEKAVETRLERVK